MNLPRVKIKPRLLCFVFVLCLCQSGVVANAAAKTANPTRTELNETNRLVSQIGFYDLISQKQEIYDIELSPSAKALLVNVTTQADNSFLLKGKIVKQQQQEGDDTLQFLPVYYNNPLSDQLIDSLFDSAKQDYILLSKRLSNNDKLVVAQNGLLFVYPASKVLPLFQPQSDETNATGNQ